eukprot:14382-Heterococcus_DN1.PRE.4
MVLVSVRSNTSCQAILRVALPAYCINVQTFKEQTAEPKSSSSGVTQVMQVIIEYSITIVQRGYCQYASSHIIKSPRGVCCPGIEIDMGGTGQR